MSKLLATIADHCGTSFSAGTGSFIGAAPLLSLWGEISCWRETESFGCTSSSRLPNILAQRLLPLSAQCLTCLTLLMSLQQVSLASSSSTQEISLPFSHSASSGSSSFVCITTYERFQTPLIGQSVQAFFLPRVGSMTDPNLLILSEFAELLSCERWLLISLDRASRAMSALVLVRCLRNCVRKEKRFRIWAACSRVSLPLRWRQLSSCSQKMQFMQSQRKDICLTMSLMSSCLLISSLAASQCFIRGQSGCLTYSTRLQKAQPRKERKWRDFALISSPSLKRYILAARSTSQATSLYLQTMSMATMTLLNSPPRQEMVSSYFLKERVIYRDRLDLRRYSWTNSSPWVMNCWADSWTMPPRSVRMPWRGQRLSSVLMAKVEMKMLAVTPKWVVNSKQLRSSRQVSRQSELAGLMMLLRKQQLKAQRPVERRLGSIQARVSPADIVQFYTLILIYLKISEEYLPSNSISMPGGRHSQEVKPSLSKVSPRRWSTWVQTVRLHGTKSWQVRSLAPFLMLFLWEKRTLKYLVAASLRSIPLMPSANRKGVLWVAKREGVVSSLRVVFDMMVCFSKVLKMVRAKRMAKVTKMAIETTPPVSERYSGFSLQRRRSVVQKRSQARTNSFDFRQPWFIMLL